MLFLPDPFDHVPFTPREHRDDLWRELRLLIRRLALVSRKAAFHVTKHRE